MKKIIILTLVFITSALIGQPKDISSNERLQEISEHFADLNDNLQEISSEFGDILKGSSDWLTLFCYVFLAGIEEELQNLLTELDTIKGSSRLKSKVKKALSQTRKMNKKMNVLLENK